MVAVANFVRTAERSYLWTGCVSVMRFSESTDGEMKEVASGYRVMMYVRAIQVHRYECKFIDIRQCSGHFGQLAGVTLRRNSGPLRRVTLRRNFGQLTGVKFKRNSGSLRRVSLRRNFG